MQILFLSLELGSVADWVTGFLTFLSVSFAFYLHFHHEKPKLNFELVNWPEEYVENGENKLRDSFWLLIQNEEQVSLNIKISSYFNYDRDKIDDNLNNRIIHFPSIDSSNKPIFLPVVLELNKLPQTFVFENLANKKKVKVTVVESSATLVLYRGRNGIDQVVNRNLKEDNIKKLKY